MHAQKEYDKAIADYGEAIRLNPGDAEAYARRGCASRAGKRYDQAITDFDEAIRLDPKDSEAYYGRSVVEMILRRGGAVAGFKTVLELDGGDADSSVYALILGHFAARLARDDKEAKTFIERAPRKPGAPAWPYAAVQLLRGEIDEAALLAAAVDDDNRTEARCYLGLDYALKGHKDLALAHFRWVRDHGNPAFATYTIALDELERLEKPVTKPQAQNPKP